MKRVAEISATRIRKKAEATLACPTRDYSFIYPTRFLRWRGRAGISFVRPGIGFGRCRGFSIEVCLG